MTDSTPSHGIAGATDAEWKRFLDARQGDVEAAREMLTAHLTWRQETLPLAPGAPSLAGIPAYLSVLEHVRSRDGCRVLLVHGAMYDASAGSNEQYALAVAALIEAALDRRSDEKVVVLVDARGGDGWANPRPWSIVPWVRTLSSTLSDKYPRRDSNPTQCVLA
jgi:hypothetical protein